MKKNGDFIPYSVGHYSAPKTSNFMLHKNLYPDEIEKKRKETFVEEGEDCIDKLLNLIK